MTERGRRAVIRELIEGMNDRTRRKAVIRVLIGGMNDRTRKKSRHSGTYRGDE
ncbi:hypothetical protein [Virgibacillus ainsalahensis]